MAEAASAGDPLTMFGLSALGIGLEAFGMSEQRKAAGAQSAAAIKQIQDEGQVNALKWQAEQMMADRQKRENIRNVQRARSLSVAQAANDTGSLKGSGLAGSLSAESAQGGVNAQAISQNLLFGKENYLLQGQISSDKIAMANAQKDMQTAQGWSSLGASILGAAPGIAKFI